MAQPTIRCLHREQSTMTGGNVAVAVRLDVTPDDSALLFERHSKRIYAYCMHVTRDRGDAEDAVQTTFLNAHRALQRGVRPEYEYAWLHTIAKNACRTLQRAKGRRAPIAGDVDVDTIPVHGDDGADELRALLAEALAELPETQRRAVVLREWHGLTPIEIAPRLGLSVQATYAVLSRARRSLANALTTTVRGPLSALQLGALGDLLRAAKALLGSTAAKTAAAAGVATVTVGVGGIAVERSLDGQPRSPGSTTRVVTPVASTAGTGLSSATARGSGVQPRERPVPMTAQVAASSRPAAAPKPSDPSASEPAVPAPGSSPAPPTPQSPAPPDAVVDAPAVIGEPPLPPLPPLPGVPPLLPELTSGGSLPPVEVPPLPPAPELLIDPEVQVNVEVQVPQLPLP
jgi:RNA polymerase sigma factor (sigma-70 family)